MPSPPNLGKYEVLERIAKGGMAEVYRAKAVGIAGFERILAVKRILPRLAQQPRFIRSFVSEARIAVSLNHRNIVQVVDFGRADGELFLAMELIDGVDLRSAMIKSAETEQPLGVALACYILGEVAGGIDYAHRKCDGEGRPLDIVHCDVSPQNVMLSFDGFIKLLDFGVARAGFVGAPTGKRLRGKPRYMAPEQTRGETPTAATDVFALGIIAWEILTGLRLFEGNDVKEILEAVRRADAPPVDKLNPEVPHEVSAAIARALSSNPDSRGSAGELSDVFVHAARSLSPELGSRNLASWLTAMYPRPLYDSAEVPTLQVDAKRVAEDDFSVEDTTEVEGPTSKMASMPVDGTSPAEGALLEKRRVVAAVVTMSGGAPNARHDLARIIAHLGYKRNAIVQPEKSSVLTLFGLEVAGEDDVGNAMRFALDALEVAEESKGGIELRIAIRTGIVVHHGDESVHVLGDALGSIRELAARAEPRRPLLLGKPGRLARSQFGFRPCPELSGTDEIHELIGVTEFDERARALHQRAGRFIGRERELSALEAHLDRAVSNNQRITVAVTGRAGVGKSRLIAEFANQAIAGPHKAQLMAVSATSGMRESPFALIGDLLQGVLGLARRRGGAARGELTRRLSSLLSQIGLGVLEIDEMVATLELALELRDGALITEVQASSHLRDAMAATVRRLRTLAPANQPRVVVVEDLHLADAASRAVIDQLLAPPAPSGAELVILTARGAGDDLPAHVDEHIALDDLDAFDRDRLIRECLGRDAAPSTVAAVAERAGGHPLFIEELAEAARETEGEIPASARDVIAARVDRLSMSAKIALQHAAVIGPSFRTSVLEDLLSVEIDRIIGELVDAGLVERSPLSSMTEGDELSFRHGIIREVVYESLTQQAKASTHAKLGCLLAERFKAGRDEPPATVARHLELGGMYPTAAPFWLRAGRVSLAFCFADNAVKSFDRALECAADADADADEIRWNALANRARAHQQLGNHDAMAEDLLALERASAGDNPRIAEFGELRAVHFLRLGDYTAALTAADIAERAALAADDRRTRGDVLRVRGEAYERLGQYDRALAAVDQAIDLFKTLGNDREANHAQVGKGRIYLMRSQYRLAELAYRPVIEQLDTWSDPWLERLARNHLAVIHLCTGNFEEAMASARKSLAICERYGDRARAGDNESVCGIILSEVGQLEAAAAHFERALNIHRDTDSKWSRADCLVHAGINLERIGNAGQARSLLDEALELATAIGARYVEANALCAIATTMLNGRSSDDLGRAIDSAFRAVEVAGEASLINAEIQGCSLLGKATWKSGDLDQAVLHSKRAITLLEEQEFIEGAEEEVYYTHYMLLTAAGDDGSASRAFEAARESLHRKLGALTQREWRRSFTAIPVNAAILDQDRS